MADPYLATAGEHVPTAQETAIYQALGKGDMATIDELRQAATAAGPDEQAQFETDYQYAWNRYQADHEAPQEEREQATVEEVVDENADAELAG